MKMWQRWLAVAAVCAGARGAVGQEVRKDYPVQAVPFTQVHAEDEFWAPRMEINRTASIPSAFQKCEESGRMDNFKLAAGMIKGEHKGGFPFDDTDPYKVLEGASYALAIKPDPKLDKYLDDLIALIAAAQEKDGYLYTCRTNNAKYLDGWSGAKRWSKEGSSHELYNSGHLFEAAVAHFQATGKRTLLDVAIKNADLLVANFGPDKLRVPPGHQIVEMGLAKLYRVTGNEKYIQLAKFFLDERGQKDHHGLYGEYSQDHKPVIEQDEAVGHAVRAVYMYSGMADVAALSGDASYAKAIDRIWDNVVSKKLYVTGGVGATGSGEAFGANYELPNLSAYCETCAAIGHVMWNQRLFQLKGESKYVDVLERSLYNALMSGVSLDGKLFFYPNPLESRGNHERSAWFGCACCPGNMTRFVASVPGYAYAHRGNEVFVNLFMAGRAQIDLGDKAITVRQETRYPWDGKVRITVEPTKGNGPVALMVRIPGWARNQAVPSDLYRFADQSSEAATVTLNGQPVQFDPASGYAKIEKTWTKQDVVELNLPMPVRRVLANEKVKDDLGRVAIQRGPIVYCAEFKDNLDGKVLSLLLEDGTALKADWKPQLLGGVMTVTGKARPVKRDDNDQRVAGEAQDLVLIPYYAWANRGRGEMAVWMARELSAVRAQGKPTLAATSKVSASFFGDFGSLFDQEEPKSSNDHANPYYHWWPRKGGTEWVQYEFKQPVKVSEVEIYWFDDSGSGECRVPQSWKLLARVKGQWKEVSNPSGYGVAKDKFNKTTFEPVEAEAVKIEIQSQKNFAGGILEWRVK